jgi:hypothetical protein
MCIYSCRPREYVVQETLEHSSTVDENLEKLMDSGFGIVTRNLTDSGEKISPSDKMLSIDEQNLSGELMAAKKLIILKYMEKEFNKTLEENKDATTAVIGMGPDGGPVIGIVKEGKLLSNIGMTIYYNPKGQQIAKFMMIN